MSVGSTMAYVQRKLPASGLTVTDTGKSPAVAVGAVAAATAAAANRRAIHVPRIKRSSTGDKSGRPRPHGWGRPWCPPLLLRRSGGRRSEGGTLGRVRKKNNRRCRTAVKGGKRGERGNPGNAFGRDPEGSSPLRVAAKRRGNGLPTSSAAAAPGPARPAAGPARPGRASPAPAPGSAAGRRSAPA